ncbi:hypothetical protein APSETT444_007543 [Aspergillus pseudonomiae]
MASEMQNSNPTILNAADLPTRLRPALSRKPGILESGLFAPAFLSVDASEILIDEFTASSSSESDDDLLEEPIDEQEIYASPLRTVTVLITPTITHCSLATVIGLGVRVRLEQSLPPRFRVDVRIKEGTHSTADEVNKQLADKERVAAALENGTLMGVIAKMLETCQ